MSHSERVAAVAREASFISGGFHQMKGCKLAFTIESFGNVCRLNPRFGQFG